MGRHAKDREPLIRWPQVRSYLKRALWAIFVQAVLEVMRRFR